MVAKLPTYKVLRVESVPVIKLEVTRSASVDFVSDSVRCYNKDLEKSPLVYSGTTQEYAVVCNS